MKLKLDPQTQVTIAKTKDKIIVLVDQDRWWSSMLRIRREYDRAEVTEWVRQLNEYLESS